MFLLPCTKAKHYRILGFIFKIPIISYNIHITNYDDDLYKVLGGSMHSETKEEFIKNLKQLSNESFKKKMILKQEIACKNFCDINKIPSDEIIKIIRKELLNN